MAAQRRQVQVRIRRGPQVPRTSDALALAYRSDATAGTAELLDRIDSVLQ